jgi:hypothetical protein
VEILNLGAAEPLEKGKWGWNRRLTSFELWPIYIPSSALAGGYPRKTKASTMALRRKYQKKNLVRPRKSGAAKRRRHLEQERRLVGLGVEQKLVDQMTQKEIRMKLQRPAKVLAELAKD